MSIPELHGFLEAIYRRSASENATFVSNVAVASQGDGKQIKKTVESFTKILKPKPRVSKLENNPFAEASKAST